MIDRISMAEVAVTNTPVPSKQWVEMDEQKRISVLQDKGASNNREWVDILAAKENGHIVVALRADLGAAERGKVLLDVEEDLKEQVDAGLTIWLEPKADKSALRKFRGIEVKQ